MKKLVLTILFLSPLLCFSQKKLEELKLANGKEIIVYDDKSWEYKDYSPNIKSSSFTSQSGTSSTSSSSTNRGPSASIKHKSTPVRSTTRASISSSSYCGARTKKGGSCRRLVKGGGRCYQH